MAISSYNKELFHFLDNSPTPFHAVAQLKESFLQNNFTQLYEGEKWTLKQGKSYFVSRENGALIAFTLGKEEKTADGFRIITAHSDSPCLQIKPLPDISSKGYSQLGVEVYGGSLLSPWFDRSLSLAGRVCCSLKDGSLQVFLLDFERSILTIPSVAIHLNREANNSASINKQKDLPPITGLIAENGGDDFKTTLKKQLKKQYRNSTIEDILSYDVFCYDMQKAASLGLRDEFITSSRLDNLLSSHACMKAMIDVPKKTNTMFYIANHEENGSMSSTGAQGSFVSAVFERIIAKDEQRRIALGNSFLISVDNAHATHPNAVDSMDPQHSISLNKGVVIKINANQRYATNSTSSAIFKKICGDAGVAAQEFVMRSDMPCGSTIGPLTAARLGVLAVDVGAASLGMHSIRELTGSDDPAMMYKCLRQALQSNVHKEVLFP